MASADVFRAYLQPPKSMMDYEADYDRADANKLALLNARQQLDAGAFEAQTKRQAFDQGQQKLNKLRALYADPAMQGNPTALENAMLSDPLTAAEGLAARKERLGNAKTEAETSHLGAQTGNQNALAGKAKEETEAARIKADIEKHDTAMKHITAFNSPRDAYEDLRQKTMNGEIPQDRAQALAQQINAIQTPEQWAMWQVKTLRGLMSAKDQLESQRQATNDAATNANRPLIADPARPGQFVANAPLQQYEKDKAKAGASNVSVKVDAKLGEGLAKEVGPMMADSLAQANGARQSIDTADQLIKAIDSGKVIAGPGADYRLKFAQIAQATGVGGKDGEEQIANTRAAIQGLAKATLDARGSMKGQGSVSDYEGRVLARAASGEINEMTPAEIKLIAQVNKRLAVKQVELHNRRVDKLKANPGTKDLADFYESIPLPSDQPDTTAPGAAGKPAQSGKGKTTDLGGGFTLKH